MKELFSPEQDELLNAERNYSRLRYAVGLPAIFFIFLVSGKGNYNKLFLILFTISLFYAAITEYLLRRKYYSIHFPYIASFIDSLFLASFFISFGNNRMVLLPFFFGMVIANAIHFGLKENLLVALVNSLLLIGIYIISSTKYVLFFPNLFITIFFLFLFALITGYISQEKSRQYRRALQQQTKTSLLLSINKVISSIIHIEELLAAIVRESIKALHVQAGSVVLLEKGTLNVQKIDSVGDPPLISKEVVEYALREKGFLYKAMQGGAFIWDRSKDMKLLEDRLKEIKSIKDHPLNQDNYLVRNILIIPIKGRSEGYGFLVMFNKLDNKGFTKEDLEILDAIASESALALENSLLFEDLKNAQERQTELLHKLLNAQEEERKHIVGELHDRAGIFTYQFLFGLKRCESMFKETNLAAQQEIERLRNLVSDYNKTIRRYFHEISPPILNDLGLIPALEQYLYEIQGEGGLNVSLSLNGISPSISPESDLILYRIIQEAILNIRKHAHATHIELIFQKDDSRGILRIIDNGVGFDPKGASIKSFGLLYMKERAKYIKGGLEINSSKGAGTEIIVTFPLLTNFGSNYENSENNDSR